MSSLLPAPLSPATGPVATSCHLHSDTTPWKTPQDKTGCWLYSCSLFLGRDRAALLPRPTSFSGPLADVALFQATEASEGHSRVSLTGQQLSSPVETAHDADVSFYSFHGSDACSPVAWLISCLDPLSRMLRWRRRHGCLRTTTPGHTIRINGVNFLFSSPRLPPSFSLLSR